MPGYENVGRNEWTGHDARMVVNLAKIAPRTPANAAEVCVDLTSAIAALPNWTPRPHPGTAPAKNCPLFGLSNGRLVTAGVDYDLDHYLVAFVGFWGKS